jgi:hypothetical protein
MITSKITKGAPTASTEERVLKLLESIDWKLWEMYNMMKDNLPEKPKATKPAKISPKKEATPE